MHIVPVSFENTVCHGSSAFGFGEYLADSCANNLCFSVAFVSRKSCSSTVLNNKFSKSAMAGSRSYMCIKV